ncbi:conserved hypothetical protein [Tenacibaculum sp. 190524A02b]|uniref:HTH cro/C1-type domain-containing protein n=1 Tax=Tenacibaculum vairaonense TaxID=3137860 RepID=A0ABM9PP21_9FLAO
MFKDILRKYLEIKGISQIELSKIVGDTQQAISDFLSKDGNPQRKTREKYFDKLEGFLEFYNETSKKQDKLAFTINAQKNENLKEKELETIINAILLHEEELMGNKVFKQWLELKLLKRENEIYKEIKLMNDKTKDN